MYLISELLTLNHTMPLSRKTKIYLQSSNKTNPVNSASVQLFIHLDRLHVTTPSMFCCHIKTVMVLKQL